MSGPGDQARRFAPSEDRLERTEILERAFPCLQGERCLQLTFSYLADLTLVRRTTQDSCSVVCATPRLAVVLSCWDELEDAGTPEEVFAKLLPLLHAFVRSTWLEDAWSVWALSSLGRALRPDERDEEFASQGPEHFGFVIPPGSIEHDSDLTAPVAWLLKV